MELNQEVNNQRRIGESVPLKIQECSDVMCDMGKRSYFVLFFMADNKNCVEVHII